MEKNKKRINSDEFIKKKAVELFSEQYPNAGMLAVLNIQDYVFDGEFNLDALQIELLKIFPDMNKRGSALNIKFLNCKFLAVARTISSDPEYDRLVRSLSNFSVDNDKTSNNKGLSFQNCSLHELRIYEASNPRSSLFSKYEIIDCEISHLDCKDKHLSILSIENTLIERCSLTISDIPKYRFIKSKFGKLNSVFNYNNISIEFHLHIEMDPPEVFFEDCTFVDVPTFMGNRKSSLVTFVNSQFLNTNYDRIFKYKDLAQMMRDNHCEYEAYTFDALELQCFHSLRTPLLGSIYSSFSDYGRNLLRPLHWIVKSFFVFFLLYLVFNLLIYKNNEGEMLDENIPFYLSQIMDSEFCSYARVAAIKSLTNTLGPIGFFYESEAIQYKNFFAVTLGFIQKIASTTMWFLWILQVRRRFKLS